jgi:RNA polymerase sigma-70 factor (ECF subfamily)
LIISGEKRLVHKLKRRDPRAFERLVNQFQTPVFNLVYRMLGSKEEAEDLAQEVFVTIFKKIDTFRGDSSLSTWVYRIATNHCKNRKKYLGRRRGDQPLAKELDETEFKGPETMRTAAVIDRPDELVEGYQAEQLIQDAMRELEEDQRLILVLRDIQNVSYDDISTITGLPLGTVKSRLHRARMCLKDKLTPILRTT